MDIAYRTQEVIILNSHNNYIGGLVILQESYHKFLGVEKQIADYILKNPKKVVPLTIKELAQKTETSTASITRFCKKIGMKDFRALKLTIAVAAEQMPPQRADNESGEEDFSVNAVSNQVFDGITAMVDKFKKVIDEKKIEKTADKLLNSNRIFIYGAGSSGIVAMDFMHKLIRIGLTCIYNQDIHLQQISSLGLNEKDVVFAISYSGETRDVYNMLENGKKAGAYCISLTRFGDSSIAGLADLRLFVPSHEPLFRLGAIISRVSQLTILDIIFLFLISKSGGKYQVLLEESNNLLSTTKILR